ncbi:biopolymer transporter ExbD [Asticcacaulis sp. AC402]|uniref:ExbD/TolR family protein n=1 Tax=Asticcacaulis sp. AC402 TaxID=1282361 RepID=UPI0003C3E742|nr:hypothetical protein [Asticcacaulis sp. AC402]ESQ73459.1 hypothetical protein ABAC402_19125 [Asticcacaulis sp. AC402]
MLVLYLTAALALSSVGLDDKDVRLPPSGTAAVEKPLYVHVTAQATIVIHGETVALADLPDKVRLLLKTSYPYDERIYVVSEDGNLDGYFAEVIDLLHLHGFERVAIISKDVEGSELP